MSVSVPDRRPGEWERRADRRTRGSSRPTLRSWPRWPGPGDKSPTHAIFCRSPHELEERSRTPRWTMSPVREPARQAFHGSRRRRARQDGMPEAIPAAGHRTASAGHEARRPRHAGPRGGCVTRAAPTHTILATKPFGLMLEALDDLRPNEVYVATGGSFDMRCGAN